MYEKTPLVNFNDLNPEFARQVMDLLGEDILACFNCGYCTGSCPIVPYEMNMRKLIQKVIFGFSEEILSSKLIWFCSECNLCGERCPQNVKPYEIVRVLRHMAIENGITPLIYKVMAQNLVKTGRVTEFSEAIDLRREQLELSIADSALSENVVKEINTILTETSFNEMINKKKDIKKEE